MFSEKSQASWARSDAFVVRNVSPRADTNPMMQQNTYILQFALQFISPDAASKLSNHLIRYIYYSF